MALTLQAVVYNGISNFNLRGITDSLAVFVTMASCILIGLENRKEHILQVVVLTASVFVQISITSVSYHSLDLQEELLLSACLVILVAICVCFYITLISHLNRLVKNSSCNN
jgi:hypothetical protein